MSEVDFDAVIRVHLKGAWSPSHHAAKHWRDRVRAGESLTGRVINTTSGAGLVGNFGQTSYATAKAGIVGFTQTLSPELYKLGVTVNAVGPAAATRITATMPGAPPVIAADRSEEHTSELQSLMRITSAVFCLKQNKILQSLMQ